jgi:hypothetical protein
MTIWKPKPPHHSEIAERWQAQYRPRKVWRYCGDDRGSKRIHAELLALGG